MKKKIFCMKLNKKKFKKLFARFSIIEFYISKIFSSHSVYLYRLIPTHKPQKHSNT